MFVAQCGMRMRMITVQEVDPEAFIQEAAARLEADFEPVEAPEWSRYAKSGVHKQRPPQQDNWWYIRSAAVLRKVYLNGPIGTERLRNMYGGRYRRGHAPEHSAKASGKVIRTVLQQLEEAGLVETVEGEGRNVTSEGQSFLDTLAKDVAE